MHVQLSLPHGELIPRRFLTQGSADTIEVAIRMQGAATTIQRSYRRHAARQGADRCSDNAPSSSSNSRATQGQTQRRASNRSTVAACLPLWRRCWSGHIPPRALSSFLADHTPSPQPARHGSRQYHQQQQHHDQHQQAHEQPHPHLQQSHEQEDVLEHSGYSKDSFEPLLSPQSRRSTATDLAVAHASLDQSGSLSAPLMFKQMSVGSFASSIDDRNASFASLIISPAARPPPQSDQAGDAERTIASLLFGALVSDFFSLRADEGTEHSAAQPQDGTASADMVAHALRALPRSQLSKADSTDEIPVAASATAAAAAAVTSLSPQLAAAATDDE